MTFRSAFHDLLTGDANISGEVSDRVYPVHRPIEATDPLITYQVISDQSEPHLGGASRIKRARVQIDAWAETPTKCETIMDDVRTLLDGTDTTQSGIRFRAAMLDNEQDLYEESIERYRITSDYEIVYWSTS